MGFTFRNQHSLEFGIICKTIENPAKPSLRIDRIRILGKDGTIKFEDGYEDKKIELECVVKGSSFEELEIKMQSIIQWISEKGTLVMDYAPTIVMQAKVYEEISPQRYRNHYVFDLIFECDS